MYHREGHQLNSCFEKNTADFPLAIGDIEACVLCSVFSFKYCSCYNHLYRVWLGRTTSGSQCNVFPFSGVGKISKGPECSGLTRYNASVPCINVSPYNVWMRASWHLLYEFIPLMIFANFANKYVYRTDPWQTKADHLCKLVGWPSIYPW